MSSKSDSSTILHNGRSTSQVSIYDYPEHLNPFYEAENHKRIRFWKIGGGSNSKNKNSNKKNEVSRRGSFSLNGLKEMWAFKSFRPKKQSSTTVINKTSESPPPLRRDLQNDTNYGTYDPRMRHTIQNDSFQRNVPYRTSLQDVRSSTTTMEYQNGFGNNNNGFGRNQQYRSTIQTPHRMKRYENSLSNTSTPHNLTPLHRRYVYGGSVTPQPTIRNNNNNKGYNYSNNDATTTSTNFSRGSSQLSVATNPFDDDNNDIVIGHNSSINSASSNTSLNKQPVRKKRRAPQPPSPNNSEISKAIEEESTTTSQNIQNNENNNDILNLTAEIETFVKNSDNNDIIIKENNNNTKELIITEEQPKIINDSNKIIKNDENITTTTIIIQNHQIQNNNEKIINTSSNNNYPKITPRSSSKKSDKIKNNNKNNVEISPKIIITEIQNNDKNNGDEQIEECKNLVSSKRDEISIEKTDKNQNESNKNHVEVIKINQYEVNKIKVVEKSDPMQQYNQTNGYATQTKTNDHVNVEKEITNENLNNSNNINKLENNNNITEINFIKPKTEEEEIVKKITTTSSASAFELKITESEEDLSKLATTIENENEFGNKYQIRYVPLKDNSPKVQRRKSRSTSPPPENYVLPPVPIARRRSVRDIIESINRSQSLLKPNQKTDLNSNNNNDTINILTENNLNKISEKQFIENNNNNEIKMNNHEIIKQPSPSLSIEQNDSNIIFEKCTTFKVINNNSRESSPTTSNLDWNPLPKPKRTKKLSADLMITEDGKSNNNNI